VCSNELLIAETNRLEKQGLLKSKELENIREWLETVRASALALGEMIENMLTFCKVNMLASIPMIKLQNDTVLQSEPVLLKNLLNSLKQLIYAYPKSPEVQIVFDVDNMENSYVMADQVSLHQVNSLFRVPDKNRSY
jgi:signal transduction histidine kinase